MLKIKSINVLTQRSGRDQICLTLEAPLFPDGDDATAVIHIQKGAGVEWAKKAFPGHAIEVTDCKTGSIKFSEK